MCQKRREIRPASGTWKWVRKPTASLCGILRITSNGVVTDYAIQDQEIPLNEDGYCGRLWDLVRVGVHYRVTENRDGELQCDCWDWYARNREYLPDPDLRECKHIKAIRGAYTALSV